MKKNDSVQRLSEDGFLDPAIEEVHTQTRGRVSKVLGAAFGAVEGTVSTVSYVRGRIDRIRDESRRKYDDGKKGNPL